MLTRQYHPYKEQKGGLETKFTSIIYIKISGGRIIKFWKIDKKGKKKKEKEISRPRWRFELKREKKWLREKGPTFDPYLPGNVLFSF